MSRFDCTLISLEEGHVNPALSWKLVVVGGGGGGGGEERKKEANLPHQESPALSKYDDDQPASM